jgi:hypothetical protein
LPSKDPPTWKDRRFSPGLLEGCDGTEIEMLEILGRDGKVASSSTGSDSKYHKSAGTTSVNRFEHVLVRLT